jgi:PmbA protein
MTLETLTGPQILDLVRRGQPKAQAEVFLVESDSKTHEWSEGKPENQVAARVHGAGLRIINEQRLGFSHSNRLEGDALLGLVDRASASSQSTTPDEALGLPDPVTSAPASLDLVDSTLQTDWAPRWGFLKDLEERVKAKDKRFTKVLRASYSESRSKASVLNTRGVTAHYEGTSVSFSLACVAVENGETQIGYGFQAARHAKDLPIDWVVEKTVENTLALLGGKQVPSGVYDLILDPLIAAEMLELFAHAVRADQVQKGKSFFAGKVGQKVGAPSLNLVDDGRLLRGLGSSPFDAEGIPTQANDVLKEGVLQGYLYDSYTARKAGRASTGSAGRGSYKGVPEPDTTNFYLRPGTRKPSEILKSVTSGIYVRNVMGLHTVDTISGDYSLGLMGQRIEHGELTHGVRGVTMAGNLLDLFQNVEAVGTDLTFFGSVGSPTLWIRGVSIGGQ